MSKTRIVIFASLAAIVIIATAAYIAGTINTNNKKVEAFTSETIPAYFYLHQQASTHSTDGLLVTAYEVENGKERSIGSIGPISVADPFGPYMDVRGGTTFVAKDGSMYEFGFFDPNKETLAPQTESPKRVWAIGPYTLTGVADPRDTLPNELRDYGFMSIEVINRETDSTTILKPSIYGLYSTMTVIGYSPDKTYVYLFVENMCRFETGCNQAIIKQSLTDVETFTSVMSISNPAVESIESAPIRNSITPKRFIQTTGRLYVEKYVPIEGRNYDEGMITVIAIDCVDGETTDVASYSPNVGRIVFSNDGSRFLVQKGASASVINAETVKDEWAVTIPPDCRIGFVDSDGTFAQLYCTEGTSRVEKIMKLSTGELVTLFTNADVPIGSADYSVKTFLGFAE